MMTDVDLPPDFETVRQAEQARTADYLARGVLRELWLFADYSGALLLCEAETLEGAQAISAGYPMVEAGYITHEIHPLLPGTFAEQPHGEAG